MQNDAHDDARRHCRPGLPRGQVASFSPVCRYSGCQVDVRLEVMTETEWLVGNDPGPMLDFLRGRASERKLRIIRRGML